MDTNTKVEQHQVVIVGAGVAGLALGAYLRRHDVDCVIVEGRTRDYAQTRQRGGTLDSRGVRMFRDWGMPEVVQSQQTPEVTTWSMYVDGQKIPTSLDDTLTDSRGEGAPAPDEAVFIPQQVLVSNLTEVFMREGGDLRFGSSVTSIEEHAGPSPLVHVRDTDGSTSVLGCEIVAGADGFLGVSRASIPEGVLTAFTHEFGMAWLTLLVQVPTTSLDTAVHERGFAAYIPRGVNATRVYLQVPLGADLADWPDERIWAEVDQRFGSPRPHGTILSRQVVPLRSVVFEPMQHGALFLLGDAAHLVPPMSAKGIHLALHDAELLGPAIIRCLTTRERDLLDGYSQAALDHVWNYQAFAAWTTRMHHDAGDDSVAGPFAKRLAQAELRRLGTSAAALHLYEEFLAGVG